MNPLVSALSILTLLTAGTPIAVQAADGDPAAGQARSVTCAGCHGQDGNSVNPEWPNLAGQHESYIYKQLSNYKSGERVNAVMAGMVAALSDQDMRDLAAYYAAQTPKPNQGDTELLAKGEAIYRGGVTASGVPSCMGCHGPAGKGNPAARFPSLAAQHPQYTYDQLMQFKGRMRANDTGKMMRNIASRMNELDMKAVAEYIAALK